MPLRRPTPGLATLSEEAIATFKAEPLAALEAPEEERARLERLRQEDLIGLQDTLNTSHALVQAVKDEDIEELQRIVQDAEAGELLQVFVMQAFVLALKGTMLDIVRQMVHWGMPLGNEQLTLAPHVICDVTNRENFGNAWRILELLFKGNNAGQIHVDTPRIMDGWTPLCVACHRACLPLVFKLLEMQADPNVVTRQKLTPLALARTKQEADDEEQQEARGILWNMLRHHGAQLSAKDAISVSMRPKTTRRAVPGPVQEVVCADGSTIEKQAISATHTRYCG